MSRSMVDARVPRANELSFGRRYEIAQELLQIEQEALSAWEDPDHTWAETREGEELIRDLDRYPHAFVLACLLDRGMPSDEAWEAPRRIRDRLGTFEFEELAETPRAEWKRIFREPSLLHRWPDKMAGNCRVAILWIQQEYRSDARRIWADRPTSGTLILRFLEFYGFGPKLASMAAHRLVRDFGVELADHRAIDVPLDRHLVRVFRRLGLVLAAFPPEAAQYAARDVLPEYPARLDTAAYWIASEDRWCRASVPLCGGREEEGLSPCPMKGVCKTGRTRNP